MIKLNRSLKNESELGKSSKPKLTTREIVDLSSKKKLNS